ncbi:proteasome assembly chaperone family protein [Halapricum hydrolyticum]|uniref:PAC2 family protein n=1 Tax=Halapricum hydrolyticum TaxID=2979991 RepID=A0AAE3IAN3_9EURY|nr:PAC2 family protein [Halapricum hydrolyticum]MCU4717895.1 PAC2 family protein [Halapricum hydrolyticum]MCU4727060.1 PAC2 family protein [Halapricum hydrolyticum]
MAHISVHREDITLDEPVLVEGLPGLGLVGKIGADHLVDTYDMDHYASIHCEGLPEVAIYDADGHGVEPPVRIHADEERNLLVLQSDIPISPSAAKEFATCVTGWLDEQSVLPLYVTGTQRSGEQTTDIFGLSTAGAGEQLDALEVSTPGERGVVSGPTGALVYHAERAGLDALGFVVEASPQFPDPAAAKALLDTVVEPIADVEIETETLVEKAQEISEAKERLAQRMQQAEDESSQAQPVGMYQ